MKKALTNEKRIVEWLKRNAYTEREEGTFLKVIVRHVHNKSKVGDEMANFDVPKLAERSEDWAEDLGREIVNTLTVEAAQFGGMQHYAAYSVYSDAEKPVNRCILSIQGTISEDDDGLLSEPPTKEGMVAQAMRHQEANARILMATVGSMTESMRRQNERLSSMVEKLLTDKFENAEAMIEMLDQKQARDIELMKEKAKANAFEEGIKTVKMLGPAVLNRVLGAKVLPESQSGLSQVARALYGSLTQEQVANLSKTFTQEQLIQFFSIGETLADTDEKKPETDGKQ